MTQGLPRKLRHRFLVQATVASLLLVAAVGVGCAMTLHTLIDARLQAQTTEFWAARAANPGYVPPDTDRVKVYFVPAGGAIDAVPPELRLAPGSHMLPGFDRHVRVEARPEGTVYVDTSFRYAKQVMWTGAMLFALLGTLGLFVISWSTYRATRRLVMPVTWLAGKVAGWNPESPDMERLDPQFSPGDVGSEVHQLSRALRDLSLRVRALVERERDFTRDASHELRTPLTVVRVASDMLLADPETPDRSRRSLQRIQAAGRDMEAVIDAFLILAREGGIAPVSEEFEVRDVVLEEVEKARPLLGDKPVALAVSGEASPRMFAPPAVLGVVLRKLLVNACHFTERGNIDVRIEPDAVTVADTGIGMSPDTLRHVFEPFYRADAFSPLGKGFGLTIASRLSRRFGWELMLDSTPGQGTAATLRFAPTPAA